MLCGVYFICELYLFLILKVFFFYDILFKKLCLYLICLFLIIFYICVLILKFNLKVLGRMYEKIFFLNIKYNKYLF